MSSTENLEENEKQELKVKGLNIRKKWSEYDWSWEVNERKRAKYKKWMKILEWRSGMNELSQWIFRMKK